MVFPRPAALPPNFCNALPSEVIHPQRKINSWARGSSVLDWFVPWLYSHCPGPLGMLGFLTHVWYNGLVGCHLIACSSKFILQSGKVHPKRSSNFLQNFLLELRNVLFFFHTGLNNYCLSMDSAWEGAGVSPQRQELGHLKGFQIRAAAPPTSKTSPGIWFRHLPLEVFQAHPIGRRPRGRRRTWWRDYASHLVWEGLGIPQEVLENVPGGEGGLENWAQPPY